MYQAYSDFEMDDMHGPPNPAYYKSPPAVVGGSRGVVPRGLHQTAGGSHRTTGMASGQDDAILGQHGHVVGGHAGRGR